MLKSFAKSTVIAALAAVFAGAAHAQSYVTAGGTPVRSADGSCWRTASWTPDTASEECDPRKAAVVKVVPVSYTAEVLFAFDDDRLGGDSLERLDELTQKLGGVDVEKITAVGHADVIGGSHYNQLLSARRVWAVRDYLAGKGIGLEIVHLEARGDREPTAAEACKHESKAKLIACLQPDRRVTLEVSGRVRETD